MAEKIILYTLNCPKCMVLERKLKQNSIDFETHDSVDEMMKLGIKAAPALSIDGGNTVMDFGSAIKWINNKAMETIK